FDEIDGKIVGAGRIARLGIESQTLGANRLIALTGVIQVVGGATLSHSLLNPVASHRDTSNFIRTACASSPRWRHAYRLWRFNNPVPLHYCHITLSLSESVPVAPVRHP